MSGGNPDLRTVEARRPVLVIGGAGFIGTNLVHRLVESGERVIVFDNLSRPGVERNAAWLMHTHGERVRLLQGDVRDADAVREAVGKAGFVFHLAAQVAVTTSLSEPKDDFEVNASGTLHVLEAIRAQHLPPPMLFTSTNKVYGALEDLEVRAGETRYQPVDRQTRERGVAEDRPLDFHSPYGCSKGAADQYVLDYSRSYGLKTVVFRMSCIYGPHQFGTEDQGWVAHFLIRALADQPLSIYGDGLQVRDVLFVDDLVRAMFLAREGIDRLAGRAFNVGGGPGQTTSLLELIQLLTRIRGQVPRHVFGDWRTGDQRYYVSDITAFRDATGWTPCVGMEEGVRRLERWLRETLRPQLWAEREVLPV